MFFKAIKKINDDKMSFYVYEKTGRNQFRDRITVYAKGNILFERFCYGEAAGIVFTMDADKAEENGEIVWNYDACQNSKKTDAPKKLTNISDDFENLFFDEKETPWACNKKQKAGLLNKLFNR